MAFFKFRFPGQQPGSTADSEDRADTTLETVRRQARYRLVGACVLVLVAVVVFPLIFDTQPRPVAVDTPILVPDRQTVPGLSATLPSAQMPAAPLKPSVPDLGSALPEHVPAQTQPPVQKGQGPSQSAQRQSLPQGPAAPAERPAAPPLRDSVPAPASQSAADKGVQPPREEAARARALLEGDAPRQAVERHVLQVGAYTDPDKVREVRRKLEQAGLKTYAQAVEGKDGKRVVRVRIGPFDSKADADKTAARVRQMGLPVSVLRL